MSLKISYIRSDEIYREIAHSNPEQKNDLYRYKLMSPFKEKWDCYHVPMKAKTKNGYDVIMASSMLGFLPPAAINADWLPAIDLLSADSFWSECHKSVSDSLRYFEESGIDLPVKEYLFSILLANPESPYTKLNDGYCGDGGIPGYIFASLVPSKQTLQKQPVVLAHEVNHNVRFQFQKWHNDITLAEMLVCEGLAENFAAHLYGEDQIGPWVAQTDPETLNDYIKPIIKDGLGAQGMENITAYLYGDEMAQMQNYFPVGLPYCAGYACGYHMIKYYLQKSGRSITQATLLSAQEIMNEIEEFWNEQTLYESK